jgi:hypothetical protein
MDKICPKRTFCSRTNFEKIQLRIAEMINLPVSKNIFFEETGEGACVSFLFLINHLCSPTYESGLFIA